MRGNRFRAAVAALVTAVTAVTAAASAVVAPVGFGALPARAASATCGYGTGGVAASGLCWLDMSAYNDIAASSPVGQHMAMTIPGGYTIGFTVKTSSVTGASSRQKVTASRLSKHSMNYLGRSAYTGVPGRPALLSTGGHGLSRHTLITLNNMVVKDSTGQVVHGYTFVAGDAESTTGTEGLRFTSDKVLSSFASYSPFPGADGCQNIVTGIGTTSVHCTGNSSRASGESGSLLVAAQEPTAFSTDLADAGSGRQAVAFAVGTAKLTEVKAIAGSRANVGDSFDLAVRSPGGTLLATATTGMANSASTGPVTVIPQEGEGSFEFGESASLGSPSPVTAYRQSWSCTNAAASGTTTLPSASISETAAIAPQVGDAITCTVTNTALNTKPHPLIHLKVTADKPIIADDLSLLYNVRVANLGPDTATGVTLRITGWICEPDWPVNCRRLPDPHDPSGVMNIEVPLRAPLASGASEVFPVHAFLPDETRASVRTTIEVIHADQEDTASNPGKCDDGYNMQDDCASLVEPLI